MASSATNAKGSEAGDEADLHCSQQAVDLELDPTGTAIPLTALILVERPLPWPRDVALDPVLAPALELGRGSVRPFAVVPPDGGDETTVGVTIYRRDAATPGPFRRSSMRLPTEDVTDVVASIAAGRPTEITPDEEPDRRGDLLMCTHGSRDRCCGNLGTALYRSVSTRWSDLDVHRVSHTGGHRFAPTAILLPEGTGWAHLDLETLDSIVTRSVPFVEMIGHFRGSSSMPNAAAQVAEAAVAARVGWGIFDRPRQAVILAEPEPDRAGVIEIHTEGRGWRVGLEHAGFAPQPVCMLPISESRKSDPRYRVTDLDSL